MIVVDVLMISCQVSRKPKSGPLAAQRTTASTASPNTAGRPTSVAIERARLPKRREPTAPGSMSRMALPALSRTRDMFHLRHASSNFDAAGQIEYRAANVQRYYRSAQEGPGRAAGGINGDTFRLVRDRLVQLRPRHGRYR